MWKDVGKFLVKNGAPILGTVIGGPLGGKVGQMLAGKVTGDSDSSPEDILSALTQDPETILKAKELELNHKERLIALQNESERTELEQAKLDMEDRVSARKRELDYIKATGKTDISLKMIAWTVIFGFFSLSVILIFADLSNVKPEVINLLFAVYGTLGTGFGTVLNYFFGSSKGSADKTQMLNK